MLDSFIGAIIGGVLVIAAQFIQHYLQTCKNEKRDKKRKALLKQMLKNTKHEWRNMKTLSGVIGANREETARLLIDLDARSDENGKDIWAFIKNKPLEEIQGD